MPRRRISERDAWGLSVGLHGVLLATLAGGVVLTRMQPPTDTALALEAVMVDSATLVALQRSAVLPQPAPEPMPEPTPEPAPQPELAPAPQDEPAPQPARTPAPRPSAVREDAAPPDAPPKRPAPATVRPAERAPQTVKPVDPARAAAEAELQAALAEEERLAALRASGLAAQWSAAIRARIERAWLRPDSARPGLDCSVAVTQAPGGTVLRVAVRECNGDEAVRQSIEDAVLRASPLPPPPDPALFERDLILRFRPDV